MAKLYFFYGSMGSSKTANVLMTAYNYRERGQNPLLLKTGKDTRDGEKIIRSRVGLESECMLLEDALNMKDENIREYDVIIVDEAQFASEEEIDKLSDIVDFLDVPVLCYGLRSDFKQNFFPGSMRLMEIADEIKEVKTMCWCGRKATCNARYDEKGIVRDGEQFLLGSNSNYIALCRKHYKMGLLHNPN